MRDALNREDVEIVGINVRNADLNYLRYRLAYDSTFGRFPASVEVYDKGLIVNGKEIPIYACTEASEINIAFFQICIAAQDANGVAFIGSSVCIYPVNVVPFCRHFFPLE